VQAKLQPVFPYVPAARAFCDDPSVHQRHRSARRPTYRFHHGDTHNSGFKDFYFWQFVGYLDWRCREVIKKGRA
jgi:hypothetical protein